MLMKRGQMSWMFCASKNLQNKILADYTLRGQFRSPLNMQKGDIIHDFEVTDVKKFNDFNINYVALQCKHSGAIWHHFDCEE